MPKLVTLKIDILTDNLIYFGNSAAGHWESSVLKADKHEKQA